MPGNDPHRGQVSPAPDFPVLDAPRSPDIGRTVQDFHGYLEPYIDELDDWSTMPVRLAHTTTNGWCIEVGPYTLDAADVERLREAIAAFDAAVAR